MNQSKKTSLFLWRIYFVCLLISTAFFLLLGFNSPIYKFNSDHDYQWFMTMGNGLVHGKIPYRDLFEQKGPIVYFVTAFCCLFQNPGIVMLFIEILSMSLFFFFAFRICNKRLNTFYALLALPILAFAIFTSWCRTRSAATVEEFMLPIYAYFLFCWLEYILEKRQWNWLRSLCLGLCFGIMLWVKYTLFYFALAPMIIWFILSLRRRQYRTLIFNILCFIAGVLIISAPILAFYTVHNALDDLFYVYFYINLTAYGTNDGLVILSSFGYFFCIGPIVLILILWGVIHFTVRYWHERSGWLLLIAFLINLFLLVYSSKKISYYYIGLIPYSILGITEILNLFSIKIKLPKYRKWIFTSIAILCLLLSIPCSIYTYELGKDKNDYAPLVIADIIKDYEKTNNTETSLFCYKIIDFGFYNTAKKNPNNYYFVNNTFKKNHFPQMFNAFEDYIIKQTSDFIITNLSTYKQEIANNGLLPQYYEPYTGDITTSTYNYKKIHNFYYWHYELILLIKK